jgi:hypothetical protein
MESEQLQDPREPVLPANRPEFATAARLDDGSPAGAIQPIEQSITLPPGVSEAHLRLEVPAGTFLRLAVVARTPDGRLVGSGSLVFGGWLERLRSLAETLPAWLAWISMGVYAFTRLYALPAFPIYFFTDEAVQTMLAVDLLRDHLRSPLGELLPTYFQNASQYNLGVSVYLQALPYLLFGKSIWVTRGTSALVTLIAAASVGLILKRVFKSPYPWLAVLFLTITPVWFLHSRTAFETALAVTFYAAMLYFYLMYRCVDPRYLYGAVAMAALAFYSYNPARVVVFVTVVLLALSDLRYHWRNLKTALPALGFGMLFLLPLARFLVEHPDATQWQMRLLSSYWVTDMPFLQKLGDFAVEYLHGLDPLYWYLPDNWDISRHTMLDYGHLLRQTFPLGLLGFWLALRRFRDPRYRVLLIAMLAAPSGAALVRLGVTRALFMVIPAALLTALAAETVMEWARRHWKLSRLLVSGVVFLILAGGSLYMLRDALVNGPTWYSDYGMNGMQYGAQQVFGEIRQILRASPQTRILLSPNWANGTDVVARFFLSDPLPIELGSPEMYFNEARALDASMLFIMTPEEFAKIPMTRFAEVKVDEVLHNPNGTPGFYFVRLKYVDNIAEVIAGEEREHRKPQTAEVNLHGEMVRVTYPRLDLGKLADIFDGDPNTLVRTWAINPMEINLDFPQEHLMNAVTLRIGGANSKIYAKVWRKGSSVPFEIGQSFPQSPNPRDVTLSLPAQISATRLWLSIVNADDPPDGYVHLWEITLK